ncbi:MULTISPECIES: hypothetical protein [Shewanella]|uniref:Uncharacterized protein n=2 Tax=Gammaproteobacteria TaxID=1236 RepID=A0A3N4DBW9_9GAMM|nr:hypothetical protein [Shewanella psychromarinicola]AZG36005.1 hypothetical protein EGC80_14735 [Shewanella psychromarinicola]MCL1083141.1 hypothetical protein [Shewanella psychromarinicola]RPA23433.1 hypothetical protein EGC77_18805 [Shewanella psychromarinicola]
MTTLTKEEVISQLQTALENQSGKPVSIEQAGSWYKIDGAKSVRFSELDAMHANLTASSVKKVPLTTTCGLVAEPRRKESAKTAAKKTPTKKVQSTSGGLTPKQLWRQKLENTIGKQTLPQGF